MERRVHKPAHLGHGRYQTFGVLHVLPLCWRPLSGACAQLALCLPAGLCSDVPILMAAGAASPQAPSARSVWPPALVPCLSLPLKLKPHKVIP